MDANSNNGAQKYQKSYFDVVGLCCSSEVPLIEKILKPLEGVKEISVIVPSRTVIVLHDDLLTSQSDIVRVLNGARMEANVRVYGKTKLKRKWPNKFAIGCGVLWLISLFKFFYHPLRWVALAAVALGISPIALRGVAGIRNFRLDINILMLIAVIGTIALKDYLEAATIVFLFSIAEWLESMASHKATTVMSSLMSIAPQKATIAETGEVVPINDVKVNTVLAVKAGEIIPVDGVVVEGNCEVDEKTLTGESFPVAKETDSTVWAGTINLNGYVSVRTTALAEDCVVSRMAKLVEEAQNRKSRTQRLIDTCAIYYTPAVVVISAGLAAIPAAMRIHDQNRWFHIALVVLVSACPCSLILSTPVATFCALSKAATTGLLIKGGDYLETLSKIKMVAFDKTGTLTKGQFVVTDFRSLSEDVNLSTLIYWVSSIESKSSHPMAEALLDYGWSRSVEPRPESVEEFENFPGEGVYGKIDGTDIHIGNKKIGIRAGSGTVQNLETEPKGGSTIGNIYVNGTHVGLFGLSDSCRSGVAEAIKDLKSLSIRTSMLTGDNHGAARQIQHQSGYGLDEVHAELLPEDKARIIKDFQKEGRTAMVGDGLNDAIALAAADIGISMGISGSALATDTGHVILMSNDIRKIPKAVKLARKCQRKVIENIVLSFVTKAAVLALACAGHPLVSVAVVADVGTCLLVIFNSSTLLMGGQRARRKHSTHNHHHHHAHGCNDLSTADGKTETRCENRGCSSKICGSQCQPSPSISTSCRRKKCSQKQPDCGEANTLHCGHNGDSHQTVCAHRPESTDHGHFQCKGQAANSGDIHQTTCGDRRPRREEGHSRCITESPGNFDRTTCEHRPEKTENGKFQCQGHGQTSRSFDQIGCDHRRESTDHGHSGCKLENGVDDAGLGAVLHACMSLEKREMGGCCKNFREECCGKHGNHIEGGLTEIITE